MMKSAKKMIVAAGFVSLFFAPLAQAQSATITDPPDGTGDILFGVVESSVIVVATPINFGPVAPSAAGPSNTAQINLTCAPDAVGSATIGAIIADNANPASCGTITVSARGSGTSYHLRVDVGELQLIGDNPSASTVPSIAPTLAVTDGISNQPVSGLGSIDSSSTTTARGSISEGGVKTYKVGGSMGIPANQAGGNYRGEYTVAAIVQ